MKGLYLVKNPDGSVRYRLQYSDPLTGKVKRLSVSMPCASVRNERKAAEILQDRLADVLGQAPSDALLSAAIDAYVADMSFTWRESTKIRNAATLGRVLRAFPEGTILRNVSAQSWRDGLVRLSGTNAGTYNEYLKRVKAFLRWCVGHDYLSVDISGKLARKAEERELMGEERATDKYLEPAEVKILLDALAPMPLYQLLARFMILSGLRCGEALALLESDVSGSFVKVNKTLSAVTGKVGPPKTPKSNREVSITPELAACIADIRRRNAWVKAAFRFDCPLFFFSDKGKAVKYYSFNSYLSELSSRLLGKAVTTHWLRHTHASLLLAAGVPVDVISRRLGHESVQITERVYLHIIDALKKRDAELLSGVSLLGSGPQVVSLVPDASPDAPAGSL